jgi:hypothetical protein
VLEDVQAQMALVAATGADGAALRARFEALLAEHPSVNLQYARRLSGIAVRYSSDGADGEDTRLGARVPDLLLEQNGAGPVRLYELLRDVGPGRFVRLDVGGGGAGRDTDAVVLTAAAVSGPEWALRDGDGWDRPGSVLIRPDGHVADVTTW